MKKIFLLITATFFSCTAFAQVEKKENRVRIVTIENGQKKVIEKTFSDDKNLESEMKILEDSLNAKTGKNRTITIDVRKNRTIGDGPQREIIEGPQKEMRVFKFKGGEEGEDDVIRILPGGPGGPGMPTGPMGDKEFRKIHRNVMINADVMKLDEMGSATIKALRIQPNAPFNGKFNVHFNAPEKGTVTISVSDVTGKELSTDQIKDFQGDYLGQVDIKKSAKGVYFIRVTQGSDGAVRRVKVD